MQRMLFILEKLQKDTFAVWLDRLSGEITIGRRLCRDLRPWPV